MRQKRRCRATAQPSTAAGGVVPDAAPGARRCASASNARNHLALQQLDPLPEALGTRRLADDADKVLDAKVDQIAHRRRNLVGGANKGAPSDDLGRGQVLLGE